MKSPLHIFLITIILAQLGVSEQWYEPDSHLISDVQFQQLVLNDKSRFKIVKYFSPHCPFCRTLKQVVDKLKHEKEWCFQIYDFNCAWYPQHCMQNVRSPSFPYTAIHDGQGKLHEEIHGFYPEPVIKSIFDRIQLLCIQNKNQLGSLRQELEANLQDAKQDQRSNKSLHSIKNIKNQSSQDKQEIVLIQRASVESKVAQKTHERSAQQKQQIKQSDLQPTAKLDQPKIALQEQQIKLDQAQTEIKQKQQPPTQETHGAKIEFQGYLKYVIYGVTILIAGYYFHKINKGKQIEPQENGKQISQQKVALVNHHKIRQSEIPQIQEILREQSELLASVPDEQL